MNPDLILASSSKYRASLLSRLGLTFKTIAPEIEESRLNNELSFDLVKRLSIEKAQIVNRQSPHSWVIGSDQIAVYNNEVIGKPLTRENAIKQLNCFAGNSIQFITGICLSQQLSNSCFYKQSVTDVQFKNLSLQQIENYLDRDKPFDCAGSFKVESLGISLFEKVSSHDPTSLEGLPLISLCQLFEQAGIDIL